MNLHRAPSAPARPRLRRGATRSASIVMICLGLAAVLPSATAGAAQAPVGLGTATSFSVLAGSTVTNTGASSIGGDVGVHPGTAITGLTQDMVGGAIHHGGAVAQQAKTDLTTAYGDAAGRIPATDLAVELGGLRLTPGVYKGATFELTGTLTLDTQGDPAAVFIFQTETTLVTAAGSSVAVLGGSEACNVFWKVGSSATFGTGASFIGSVLAAESITASTGAAFQGRLLAQGAAVTLDTNTITTTACAASTTTTTTTAPTTTTTTAATTTSTTSTTAPSTTSTTAPSTTSTTAPSTTSTTAPAAVAVPDGTTSTTAPATSPSTTAPGSAAAQTGGGSSSGGGAAPSGGGGGSTTGARPRQPSSSQAVGRLPATGSETHLPAAGALLIAAGTLLLGLSGTRTRPSR